jgi:hypothetical protein
VSARQALIDAITGADGLCYCGSSLCSTGEELIDAYAHELAESIRNSEELRDFTDDHMSDCNAAADFIDPEVS